MLKMVNRNAASKTSERTSDEEESNNMIGYQQQYPAPEERQSRRYFKALFYSGMKETYAKEVVMKIQEHELRAHLTLYD